jgi:hypothetical protein
VKKNLYDIKTAFPREVGLKRLWEVKKAVQGC